MAESFTATPVGPSSQTTRATCPSCAVADFDCDACLHQHLLKQHGLRYSQVYGTLPNGWSDLCATHRSTTASMLGL